MADNDDYEIQYLIFLEKIGLTPPRLGFRKTLDQQESDAICQKQLFHAKSILEVNISAPNYQRINFANRQIQLKEQHSLEINSMSQGVQQDEEGKSPFQEIQTSLLQPAEIVMKKQNADIVDDYNSNNTNYCEQVNLREMVIEIRVEEQYQQQEEIVMPNISQQNIYVGLKEDSVNLKEEEDRLIQGVEVSHTPKVEFFQPTHNQSSEPQQSFDDIVQQNPNVENLQQQFEQDSAPVEEVQLKNGRICEQLSKQQLNQEQDHQILQEQLDDHSNQQEQQMKFESESMIYRVKIDFEREEIEGRQENPVQQFIKCDITPCQSHDCEPSQIPAILSLNQQLVQAQIIENEFQNQLQQSEIVQVKQPNITKTEQQAEVTSEVQQINLTETLKQAPNPIAKAIKKREKSRKRYKEQKAKNTKQNKKDLVIENTQIGIEQEKTQLKMIQKPNEQTQDKINNKTEIIKKQLQESKKALQKPQEPIKNPVCNLFNSLILGIQKNYTKINWPKYRFLQKKIKKRINILKRSKNIV